MGRKKLHIVNLKEEEDEKLNRYLRKGKSSARSLTRARILLLADEGHDDNEIAGALKASTSTVNRIFRLAKRFEYHYTPKNGSWLNMAEIELSAFSKQSLDRRIGNYQNLSDEVSAWERKEMQSGQR